MLAILVRASWVKNAVCVVKERVCVCVRECVRRYGMRGSSVGGGGGISVSVSLVSGSSSIP